MLYGQWKFEQAQKEIEEFGALGRGGRDPSTWSYPKTGPDVFTAKGVQPTKSISTERFEATKISGPGEQTAIISAVTGPTKDIEAGLVPMEREFEKLKRQYATAYERGGKTFRYTSIKNGRRVTERLTLKEIERRLAARREKAYQDLAGGLFFGVGEARKLTGQPDAPPKDLPVTAIDNATSTIGLGGGEQVLEKKAEEELSKPSLIGLNIPRKEILTGTFERFQEITTDKEEAGKLIFGAVGFGLIGGLGKFLPQTGPLKVAGKLLTGGLQASLIFQPVTEAITFFTSPDISESEKLKAFGKIQFDIGVQLPIIVAVEGILGGAARTLTTFETHIPKGELFKRTRADGTTDIFAEGLDILRGGKFSRAEITKGIDVGGGLGFKTSDVFVTTPKGKFRGKIIKAVRADVKPGIVKVELLKIESPLINRFGALRRSFKIEGAEITFLEKLDPSGTVIETTRLTRQFKTEIGAPTTGDLFPDISPLPTPKSQLKTAFRLEQQLYGISIKFSRQAIKATKGFLPEQMLDIGKPSLRIIPRVKQRGVLNIFADKTFVKVDPFIKGFAKPDVLGVDVRTIPKVKQRGVLNIFAGKEFVDVDPFIKGFAPKDAGVGAFISKVPRVKQRGVLSIFAPETTALLLKPYKAPKLKTVIPKPKPAAEVLPTARALPVTKTGKPILAAIKTQKISIETTPLKVEVTSIKTITLPKIKVPFGVGTGLVLIHRAKLKLDVAQAQRQAQAQKQRQVQKQVQIQVQRQALKLDLIQVQRQVPKLDLIQVPSQVPKLGLTLIPPTKISSILPPGLTFGPGDKRPTGGRRRRGRPSVVPKLKLNIPGRGKVKTAFKSDISAAVVGFTAPRIPRGIGLGPAPRPVVRRKDKRRLSFRIGGRRV